MLASFEILIYIFRFFTQVDGGGVHLGGGQWTWWFFPIQGVKILPKSHFRPLWDIPTISPPKKIVLPMVIIFHPGGQGYLPGVDGGGVTWVGNDLSQKSAFSILLFSTRADGTPRWTWGVHKSAYAVHFSYRDAQTERPTFALGVFFIFFISASKPNGPFWACCACVFFQPISEFPCVFFFFGKNLNFIVFFQWTAEKWSQKFFPAAFGSRKKLVFPPKNRFPHIFFCRALACFPRVFGFDAAKKKTPWRNFPSRRTGVHLRVDGGWKMTCP